MQQLKESMYVSKPKQRLLAVFLLKLNDMGVDRLFIHNEFRRKVEISKRLLFFKC